MVSTDRPHGQPGLELAQNGPQSLPIPISVTPPYEYEGLQALESDNERNKVPSDVFPTAFYQRAASRSGYDVVDKQPEEELVRPVESPKKRWLGNKKRILLVVACVVVVATIVGVVAGVLVSKQNNGSTNGKYAIVSPSEMSSTTTTAEPAFAPTAVSAGYPHLEVFALSNDHSHSIYRKYRNSSNFLPSGDTLEEVHTRDNKTVPVNRNYTASIAVAQIKMSESGKNLTWIQYAESNKLGKRINHLDDQSWSQVGTYYDAASNDFKFSSPPTTLVFTNVIASVAVFVVASGTNAEALFYFDNSQNTEFSPAREIPNSPILYPWSTPAAVAWNRDSSRLDIFVVATNNSVMHVYRSGSNAVWSPFHDLGGHALTPPVAVTRQARTIDLFIHGGDHRLWHLPHTADADGGGDYGWVAEWKAVGGTTRIAGQPFALATGATSVEVYAWGADDGALLRATYDAAAKTWSPTDGFDTVVAGVTLGGPPCAVADGTGDVHLFAYSNESELIWTTLKAGASTGTTPTVLGKITNITEAI